MRDEIKLIRISPTFSVWSVCEEDYDSVGENSQNNFCIYRKDLNSKINLEVVESVYN